MGWTWRDLPTRARQRSLIANPGPAITQPAVPTDTVDALGAGFSTLRHGQRVGVPWLGGACDVCRYCLAGQENLCDAPDFTGCTRDGGFATHVLARADFCVPLDHLALDDATAAPLLCAGLIGWRSLRMAGAGLCLGRRFRPVAARATGRRHPVGPRRRPGAAGAAGRAQGRPRGLRRHPRERHPALCPIDCCGKNASCCR